MIFTDGVAVIRHQVEVSFEGFGPCAQAAGRQPAFELIDTTDDLKLTRQLLRRQCPLTPGVYGMIDATGDLFYVGKAKALQKRLLSYFFARDDESKSRRIAEQARHVVWEQAPHELAALLRELELIRHWLPRMNRRDRPRERTRGFVCIGRAPAPYAYLATRPPRGEQRVFGPLPVNRRLRQAVRRLNDCFQLRDCPARTPLVFADQLQLFAEAPGTDCLRRAIQTCLAPCAAECSSREYGDKVKSAVAFLRGADVSILDRLEEQMRTAAAQQSFERAALLRDTWQDLGQLHGFLQRLRDGRRDYNFVYPLPAYGRGVAWYLIRQGQVARVIRRPGTPRQAIKALKELDTVYATEPTAADNRPEDLNVLLLLCQWFRRHPEQRDETVPVDVARQRCRERLT